MYYPVEVVLERAYMLSTCAGPRSGTKIPKHVQDGTQGEEATKIGFDNKKCKNLKFTNITILPSQRDMEITSIPVSSHPVNDLCDTQIMDIHLVETVDSHVGLKTVSYKGRNAVPHNLSSCVLVLRRTTLPWCEQPGCLPPPDPMLILVPDLVQISWCGG